MISMFLSEKIASSETKYKKILEEFFRGIFDISFIPSHGIDHHRRVWHYTKEILDQLADQDVEIDQAFTDKLIITCFLHDSGMTVDQGFRHGTDGRRICERFLSENNLYTDEFSDVLHAIENHDNKDYTGINKPGELLTILSVADDLDALGFIGIYRYLEIYIARKKPLQELGYLIIENSENRFQHFLRTYGFYRALVGKHAKRYDIINSFFNSYNDQVSFYKFDNQLAAGHCGVAEIVMQMLKNNQPSPDINSLASDYTDPVVQWFFAELNIELSGFR
jgi:HD superfamily phosphodiesterase